MFGFFKNKTSEKIKNTADKLQRIVDTEFQLSNDNDNAPDWIQSQGLRDGASLIHEFVEQNEIGLAIEHLIYIISEMELNIPSDLRKDIKIIADKLKIPSEEIDPPFRRKIDLQGKTKPKRGTISYYWFENENTGLKRTQFHRVKIPLVPFNSGFNYENQPHETEVIMEWLELKLESPNQLDGLKISTVKGGEEEISIYLGSAHNPCDINNLTLKKTKENSYVLDCELLVDFEHEMVAKNEIYKFQTIIDYVSEEI